MDQLRAELLKWDADYLVNEARHTRFDLTGLSHYIMIDVRVKLGPHSWLGKRFAIELERLQPGGHHVVPHGGLEKGYEELAEQFRGEREARISQQLEES